MDAVPSPGRRRLARAALTAAGVAAAAALLGGLAEAYVRVFPPRDCHAFLGEASPLRGPFIPDPDFGADYRSWQAFCDDNPRVRAYLPFAPPADRRPVWAFFGNSFVQAPGMLADTARARLPDRRVFNLGRNEHLCVRLAQARLLLDNGLRPERVFVVLMPLDAAELGKDPLSSIQVTGGGALTYRPRLPPEPLGCLVRTSALARTAWFRTGLHHAHPDFQASGLNRGVGAEMLADLDRLFAALARAADGRSPVTVVLIPNHEQITAGAPFGFQDAVAPVLARRGLDVWDARRPFLDCPDKPALFIPDKHFSEVGNRILLAGLLDHLRAVGAPAPGGADPS